MKHLILFALLALGLAFGGCQKEEKDYCENVTCYNGGVCDDGLCDCPPGTSGFDCSVKDLCYNVVCLNNGICINGTCDCPTGYTGANCGTAKTPISMSVLSMTVTKYPVVQTGGASWDLNDGADVFVTFSTGTTATTTEFKSGFTYTDVTGQDLPFSTGFPVTLNNNGNNYTVGLWDYDATSSDDYMVGLNFNPNTYRSGFPSTLNLVVSDLEVVLDVQWNF